MKLVYCTVLCLLLLPASGFANPKDLPRNMNTDGNTNVLDNQLCQVMVFSPEGEHLQDLSREGDGPGELRQPIQLSFLSDDILAIGMGFPGKVITLKLDGTPGSYYVERSWALSSQGLVYAATERNAYEISVFDQTGMKLRTFGKEYKPRKRTKAEKDEIAPMINVNVNAELEIVAEDYDECITRLLFNHDEETIWVLTPHGDKEQTGGTLETWDVFDTEGSYLKQVAIPLGHEMMDGNIYLIGVWISSGPRQPQQLCLEAWTRAPERCL